MASRTLGGRYVLGRIIGRGAFGVVYEATDSQTDRAVAVKVLQAVDGAQQDRFRREVSALSALRHPHIVQVLDVGQGEGAGEVYLVMELLRGKTLHALCKEVPLAPERAARLIVQLLLALEKAHGLDLIHRDLKPGNLFVCDPGESETLKVLDFGLARAVDAPSLTKTGEILGTPAYMAPEQARGQRVDARTDVFGAGACLYGALAGRPPIAGESPVRQVVRAMAGGATPLREVAPAVPPALAALVARAMRPDPRERYASAAEMRAALERWLALSSVRRGPRWMLRAGVAAALVSLASVGGYLGALGLSRRAVQHVATARPSAEATVASAETLAPLATTDAPVVSARPHASSAPVPAPAPSFKPCTRDAQCGPMEKCYPGGCSCVDGAMRCGDTCRELGHGRADCGCGEVCSYGDVCGKRDRERHCESCPDGSSACGEEECVDLQLTSRHCGVCGHACAPDEQCHAGTCHRAVPLGGACKSDFECPNRAECTNRVCQCRPQSYPCGGICSVMPCRP